MSFTLGFVMLGLSAAVGAFSAFVVSYMKEKGKNLATKEDVQAIVRQMSAITEATKKIEAEISDKMWSRQKHWEIKRDILFDAAKKAANLNIAMTELYGVHIHKDGISARQIADAASSWANALGELTSATTMVAFVCNPTTRQAFDKYFYALADIGKQIRSGKPEVMHDLGSDYVSGVENITKAIREEIEVDRIPR